MLHQHILIFKAWESRSPCLSLSLYTCQVTASFIWCFWIQMLGVSACAGNWHRPCCTAFSLSLFDCSSLAHETQNNVIQTVGHRAAPSLGQPGPKQRLQDDHAPLSATIKPPLYLLSRELRAAWGSGDQEWEEIYTLMFQLRMGIKRNFSILVPIPLNDSGFLTVPLMIFFSVFEKKYLEIGMQFLLYWLHSAVCRQIISDFNGLDM